MNEPSAPFRVLVVDDDPTNTLILARSLKRAGYEVAATHDGREALEIARRQRPDAILLDMLMPGMDGFETCTALKADSETETIPVLFVTGVADRERTVEAFAVGGCDYITKPFRTDEVLARVSVHVRLRRAELELQERNRRTEELAQQLVAVNAKLSMLARIDSLTKLLNRRAWNKALRSDEQRRLRYGQVYSLVMLDLDAFKQYNDNLGHQAGDVCLKRVARAIVATCRETDLAGRVGGEEFVILAPSAELDAAVKLAERVRSAVVALQIPHPKNPAGEFVTISAGVACAEGKESHEETLKLADDALYEAKRRGRNRVVSETELPGPTPADAAPAPAPQMQG